MTDRMLRLGEPETERAYLAEIRRLAGGNGAIETNTRFRWFDDRELEALPPIEALVGHHIMRESLVGLYGPSGGGKTFLALDLASAVGTGRRWHGYDTSQGPVAYILAEGRGGAGRRVAAWKAEHEWTAPLNVQFLLEPVFFLDPGHVADLANDLRTWDPGPALVVVDTLAMNFGAGDENATADMGRFIDAAKQLQLQLGTTVLVVHHTGHNKERERGSTALRAAADTMIRVLNEDGLLTVTCDKQRDSAPFAKLEFELAPSADSVVLRRAAETPDELNEKHREMLRILDAIDLGDGVTTSAWRDVVLDETAMGKTTLYRGLKVLVGQNLVESPDSGETKYRRKYRLTQAGREELSRGTI